MGSPPHGPETVAKTVWYQDEKLDQGVSEDYNRKELKSQSVWYDSGTMDQKKHEQLEQGMREQKECDLSSPRASGLSSPQLLEQALSSHQLSAALSQPHAAGAQPALSHGPGAQRREVHRSQREEEVGPDWKEGGVEGDREEVSNRETSYSRKSSETAGVEEAGEEKQGSEEKGAKGRKKRRKKRGKRGGTEAKFSSSSSVESQSQIEIQTQREQVANLNTQSETESEAKDKTGKADVQTPCAPEPTRREEADKDAMHLPSQTEGHTRDVHGPDCDVTNPDPSYSTPELSLTDPGRMDLAEVTAPQTLEPKELSEDENMNLHGPDNLHSSATASNEPDIRKEDTGEITTVQPIEKEVLDPTGLELKGLASPVQQTVHEVESKGSSEKEDLTVAGEAVACGDWTGLVESNNPKELPVKHSDPTEFTADSFLVEFPEQNTQHAQSVDSDKPVQPVDPMGRPEGFMESVHPTEAVGLPCEGTADVSPLQKGEGRAETTPREYLEHCLASEMLRDQQHKEEKRNELWMGEGEAGKERSWERRSEENDSGTVRGEESSSAGKKVEDEELPSLDREEEQNYNDELIATAVAVVTVAIASAISSIDSSQRLADSQSDSQECASEEPANDRPLAQDASVPADTLKQLADDSLSSVQSTQVSAQRVDQENRQLLAMTQADQFTSNQQAEISEELQCSTETETLTAAQLNSNQQTHSDLSALADTPSLPQPDKEESQTETIQSKLLPLCSLSKEEDSTLQVDTKPLPEANKMITIEADSHKQTEIQLQEVSQLSCPVVDTGQHPEASDIFCPDPEESPGPGEHRDPQSQSICELESGIQAEGDGQQLDSHFQHNETVGSDGIHPVESITAEGEAGRQAHEQCKAEESEGCEDASGSECQAKEHESDPQLDGQVKTPCEGETPAVPFSCASTLPVTHFGLTPVADPSPEGPTGPVNVETGECQSLQPLADLKPIPAIPLGADGDTFQSTCQDSEDGVFERLEKDSVDTVDGWKERERNKMKSEEEARKEMVTVGDTCQTGNCF